MSRSEPSRDVAIYAAEAHAFYERKAGPPPHFGGGGAEFQTAQMALRLAESGLETAHIVYPVKDLAETPERLTVVARSDYQGEGGLLAKLREARAIWKSLREADARVNILRAYGLHLVVGAIYSKLHRRPWVMSGSNDLEFMPEKRSGRAHRAPLPLGDRLGGLDRHPDLAAAGDRGARVPRRRGLRRHPQLRRAGGAGAGACRGFPLGGADRRLQAPARVHGARARLPRGAVPDGRRRDARQPSGDHGRPSRRRCGPRQPRDARRDAPGGDPRPDGAHHRRGRHLRVRGNAERLPRGLGARRSPCSP